MANIEPRLAVVESQVKELKRVSIEQTGMLTRIDKAVTRIDARNGRNTKIVVAVITTGGTVLGILAGLLLGG